jgi:signal transduction histidine kinase
MEEVAEGRLNQRVDLVGTTEVDPLLQTFNLMSSRLSDAEQERSQLLDQVEKLNRHLQHRVEVATAALAMAQADLARRERLAAMGELVGTIAHEVGTPLNSVLAHLDLMEDDLPASVDRQRLGLVVGEIERVSDIIRRYLRSTRAPTPIRESIDIDASIRESVRIFETRALTDRVSFEITTDGAEFETDPHLLTQIVRNLVSNALAATEEGDRIEVNAEVSNRLLTLEVSDSGIGMDSETRQLLFEPFYSARRDGSGTGLGMSIVRNAVGSLGGRITIESTPGKGTTVTVRLPADPEEQRPTEPLLVKPAEHLE